MEQDEPDKSWFWGRAFILLAVCSGAVVGLNIFLKGADALGSPSGAGEAVGSILAVWALGGIAPVIAHFAKKSHRKTLLKAWIAGCCVVFGINTFGQTYAPLNDKFPSVSGAEDHFEKNIGNGEYEAIDAAFNKGDYATAARLLRPLAEQGNGLAQYNLGWMYDKGDGVTQDFKEAVKWYRKAAEQGHAPAHYALGLMYSRGKGVAQDYKEAMKWERKGAELGNASAQRSLGMRYETGFGVAQDYKEAVKWYRKAAEQGHASAQGSLGASYGIGQGVIRDYVRAYMWSNIAAANGDKMGEANRDIFEKGMTAAQIAEAQKLAREWMQKHQK